MHSFFETKADLFLGMYVMHPEDYSPAQVREISEYGSVKLYGYGEILWGRSLLYPVALTPSKLSNFGFGVFNEDDKVFYHEPIKDDPDHNFYAEYSFNSKELTIITSEFEKDFFSIKYVHELQKSMLSVGLKGAALNTKVTYSGNKILILK